MAKHTKADDLFDNKYIEFVRNNITLSRRYVDTQGQTVYRASEFVAER